MRLFRSDDGDAGRQRHWRREVESPKSTRLGISQPWKRSTVASFALCGVVAK
ncbi:hypothetical protein [Mesorhizobium sp.]|uniref:hypothetical protein n=1 Tax=Mesorhizobium sp. TaxID=1871066 RepID=UPI0025D21317|nr:hypothetical protein [Mesorhizobium sp.]